MRRRSNISTFDGRCAIRPALQVCLVYLDGIIVFSETLEQHLGRLVTVLGRLSSAGLKLKPEKCAFFQKSISIAEDR